MTGVASDIRNDVDIQEASDLRLAISSATSGVAVTFNYMASQVPEMANIKVAYTDTQVAMDQVYLPSAPVDAVMVVSRPREPSTVVDQAVENPHRYRFVELSDERLTEELPNGQKIYRSMKLALPGASEPVKTICVSGLLVVNNEKLLAAHRNRLTDLVNFHWMEVYVTP